MPVTTTRQINVIVAGSLFAGLASALVLVLGPVAGTRENVIAGTALLAFALGWALLRLLSAWTGQPQRWAATPAGLLALVGGVLLVWPDAVTYDAVAWVWPPALLALAVWMTVQARRHLRSRLALWLLYPVFAVSALAAVAGGYETIQESIDSGVYTMPGELIDVGGYRLHVNCTGSGSPTVVLTPGFGEISSAWGWIAPDVARDSRVCVYDRAGRAWSESASAPQDGIGLATDLYTLLDGVGAPGPYILAGHSFGGLLVVNFAARYPEQVAGLVLLDSTHPEAFTRLPGYPSFYEGYRRISALFPSLARVGVGRLAYRSNFDSLPVQARDEERAFWSGARLARSQRDEWAEGPMLMQQAQSLHDLGDLPLIVVTAARDAQDGWMPLQDDLTRLSTNSVHRVLSSATHSSLIVDKGDAASASQAIRDVIAAARTGEPLARR